MSAFAKLLINVVLPERLGPQINNILLSLPVIYLSISFSINRLNIVFIRYILLLICILSRYRLILIYIGYYRPVLSNLIKNILWVLIILDIFANFQLVYEYFYISSPSSQSIDRQMDDLSGSDTK